jgi:small multidrug resistance pump
MVRLQWDEGGIKMSGWIYLATAILFEITGTTCMKLSYGFAKPIYSVSMVFFYLLSFSALTMALKEIPISTAYAIWSGVGTVLVALIGFAYFSETATFVKLGSISLIVVGVVGLKMDS